MNDSASKEPDSVSGYSSSAEDCLVLRGRWAPGEAFHTISVCHPDDADLLGQKWTPEARLAYWRTNEDHGYIDVHLAKWTSVNTFEPIEDKS